VYGERLTEESKLLNLEEKRRGKESKEKRIAPGGPTELPAGFKAISKTWEESRRSEEKAGRMWRNY